MPPSSPASSEGSTGMVDPTSGPKIDPTNIQAFIPLALNASRANNGVSQALLLFRFKAESKISSCYDYLFS